MHLSLPRKAKGNCKYMTPITTGSMAFFFKPKTAYEISTRDWSSDVCSSDLLALAVAGCYQPSPPNGALLCSPDHECPEGYHCAFDETCWRIGEDPDPFTQPMLAISPRNGSSTGSMHAAISRRPLFRWRAVPLAISYDVQVDDSCDPESFRSCAFPSAEAEETTTSLSLRLSAALPVSSTPPVGRRYYWRVRGCGD